MARLRRRVSPRQAMCRRLGYYCLNSFVGLSGAEHDGVAADPVRLWVRRKIVADGFESSRQINIVAIDETKNVTGRPLDSFVEGVHLPTILLADPERNSIFVFANHIERLVGATAVNHDVFEVWVVLIKDRENRLFQEPALIERRSNDTDLDRHAT